MTKFDDHASLHPKTVTKISENVPVKRRRFYGRSDSLKVDLTQLDPRVLEAAKLACQGDLRRIEILDNLSVYIHNDPQWRKSRR